MVVADVEGKKSWVGQGRRGKKNGSSSSRLRKGGGRALQLGKKKKRRNVTAGAGDRKRDLPNGQRSQNERLGILERCLLKKV